MNKVKKPYWFIIVLSLVVCFAAGPVITSHTIEYDEAISMLVVAGQPVPSWSESVLVAKDFKEIFEPLSNSSDFLRIAEVLRATDVHPPLYFYFLSGWQKVFGNSIEAARCFSLLCTGAASIIFLMLISRAGCGKMITFIAPLFLVLSPMGIYLATTARPYALALFLTICSVWAAYESLISLARKHSPRTEFLLSLASGTLAGLAILSNYLSVISFVLLGACILIFSILRRNWRIFVSFSIGSALPLMVLIWMFSAQLGARPNQLPEFEGISLILKISFIALEQLAPDGFLSLVEPHISYLVLALMSLAIVLGVFFALKDITCKAHSRIFWILTLLMSFGNIIGLFMISALQNQSFTYPRLTYITIPFWACCAAAGCKLKFQKWRIGLLIALPLLLLQLFWVYEVQVKLKTAEEWRVLARFEEQQLSLDETLVIIDTGNGRGVPASMVYELPDNAKVRMVSSSTELKQLFNDIQPYRNLLFVMSRQREGNRRMLKIIKILQDLGTHQGGHVVSNHSLMYKKANISIDMFDHVLN